jgi:hypothetical protein
MFTYAPSPLIVSSQTSVGSIDIYGRTDLYLYVVFMANVLKLFTAVIYAIS